MKPLDFPLLTDENIAADVVTGLRARGCDVRSADEERLIGRGDGKSWNAQRPYIASS